MYQMHLNGDLILHILLLAKPFCRPVLYQMLTRKLFGKHFY